MMGEGQAGGRKHKCQSQEPLTTPNMCQPLPGPGPFSSVTHWSLPTRCTRKERCERSREPRRFASEMKQCVRLTVHPSNISVSQYNVLVRAVEPWSGTWAEPAPHCKGPQPNAPREAGPNLASKATPDQHQVAKEYVPGVDELGVQGHWGRVSMHHG